MLLYHGSNMAVEFPKIIQSDRRLDFGTGFYLTSSLEQAQRWAVLTTKRRGTGSAVVTVYELDERRLSELNVLRFDGVTVEWLHYISGNRRLTVQADDYDLVIGFVANDRTMPVINLYFAGVYDETEAMKRLLPQKLKDQYAFKTESALSLLKVKEVLSE